MATIENAWFTRLTGHAAVSALVGTKVFPSVAPPETTPPYITFRVVSAPRLHHMLGASGFVDARLQTDCWDSRAETANTVSEAVRNAMDTFRGTVSDVVIRKCLLSDASGEFVVPKAKTEGGLHRRRLDFDVGYLEAAPTL